MTHLLNENDQHEAGNPEARLWAQYGTSLIEDLNDTFDLLWRQIIRPALKAIRNTIAVYWPIAYSAPVQARQLKFAQPTCRKVAHTSEAFRKTYGLSLESAIAMRKIQGSLGEDWASAIHAPTRVHQGKSNRWADARQKPAAVAIKPIPPSESVIAAPSSVVKPSGRNAPAANEEILGLDDIFTGPVKGLFLEGIQAASETRVVQPQTSPRVILPQPESLPGRTVTETRPLLIEKLELEKVEKIEKAEKPCRFDDAVIRQVRWPIADEPGTVKHDGVLPDMPMYELYAPEETTTAWFSMIEATPEIVSQAAAPDSEPAPVEPDGTADIGQGDDSDRGAECTDVGGPGQNSSDDGPAASQTDVAETKPQQKPTSLQTPKPLQPVAEIKPPKPEARKLFPDYRPLDENESGFDHMARNNRILSRSISNLVDSYFQRAAQEEEPNFY